ncbi:winged helix-turn-helix transcriptional regulator [Hyphomonas sp. WL0036]|uniref:winged helix-turn-helix transcriptional regulator n=1 Tax=Hyphomonas sediminis TaxID=2866160 RepID=UPI001C7F4F82|nr:winged helix-turn-helix transcriptional regulator [Hyphomonas sediminis]MBY9065857.1 winged helix-turn-helix transcriptional regulator [Hyphomonas sediminis]
MKYGQYCPISTATEILGEKWTILIIRELLMGGRRFNTLQRGLGDISPALLTARLKSLEQQRMLVKRRVQGQKTFEYYPTPACQALLPVILAIGEWGIVWTKENMLDSDFDVEMLMLYLERAVDPSKLIGDESVIQFKFIDLEEQKDFWLLVKGQNVDLCITDPGKDVNVYLNCAIRTMYEVWMGDRTFRDAINSGDLKVQGEPALTRNIGAWLRPGAFAETPRLQVVAG